MGQAHSAINDAVNLGKLVAYLTKRGAQFKVTTNYCDHSTPVDFSYWWSFKWKPWISRKTTFLHVKPIIFKKAHLNNTSAFKWIRVHSFWITFAIFLSKLKFWIWIWIFSFQKHNKTQTDYNKCSSENEQKNPLKSLVLSLLLSILLQLFSLNLYCSFRFLGTQLLMSLKKCI